MTRQTIRAEAWLSTTARAAEPARPPSSPISSLLADTKQYLETRAKTPAFRKGTLTLSHRQNAPEEFFNSKIGFKQTANSSRLLQPNPQNNSTGFDRLGFWGDIIDSKKHLIGNQGTHSNASDRKPSVLVTIVHPTQGSELDMSESRTLGRSRSIVSRNNDRLSIKRNSSILTMGDGSGRLSDTQSPLDLASHSSHGSSVVSSSEDSRSQSGYEQTISRQNSSLDQGIFRRVDSGPRTFLTNLDATWSIEGIRSKRSSKMSAYRRFRKIARMVAHSVHFVKYLARILKNPLEWSWEYDPKSTLQDEELSARGDSMSKDGILISHELFGVSHLFDGPKHFNGWLDSPRRHVFRKKRHERSSVDLDTMVAWCSTMKSMEKFPADVQRELLRASTYTRWHTGRQLIKEGHPARFFYIILDGDVEISKVDHAKLKAARRKSVALAALRAAQKAQSVAHIPPHDSLIETEQHNPPSAGDLSSESGAMQAALAAHNARVAELAAKRKSHAPKPRPLFLSQSEMHSPDEHEGSSTEETDSEEDEETRIMERQFEEEMNKAYTVTIGHLTSGDSFGEISFLTGTNRITSFTTKRTSEFLSIPRRAFEQAIGRHKTAETEKQELLVTQPLIQTLNADMATLNHCCIIRPFEANRVVVHQGMKSGNIYFISSGRCRVVEAVQFVKENLGNNTFKVYPLSQSTVDRVRGQGRSLPPLSPPSGLTNQLKPRAGEQLRPMIQIFTELLTIKELGPGDYFGETLPSFVFPEADVKEHILIPTAGSALSERVGGTAHSSRQPASVLTSSKASLLMISKMDFQRLASDATWRILRSDVAMRPNVRVIQDWYMHDREWKVYKKKVVRQMIENVRRGGKRFHAARNPYGINV
ncbi:hypothetical protein DFS34DRAFT_628014 [Phlyctochytrium arcticum]|nr:hypothetical protein DFS34DRAFT_628014 [Phlyctochytrium arcticum]